MSKSIYQSELIFNLNSRLFNNTLAGVTEELSNERISDHNNSFKWIAAHTTWARYNILAFLGKPVTNPYNHLFEGSRAYSSSDQYPPLSEIKEEWQKVSALLKEALESVTEQHLAINSPFRSPIGDFTNAGTIAFFAQHESYDIGQLGLLKKYLTAEAMSYS